MVIMGFYLVAPNLLILLGSSRALNSKGVMVVIETQMSAYANTKVVAGNFNMTILK